MLYEVITRSRVRAGAVLPLPVSLQRAGEPGSAYPGHEGAVPGRQGGARLSAAGAGWEALFPCRGGHRKPEASGDRSVPAAGRV